MAVSAVHFPYTHVPAYNKSDWFNVPMLQCSLFRRINRASLLNDLDPARHFAGDERDYVYVLPRISMGTTLPPISANLFSTRGSSCALKTASRSIARMGSGTPLGAYEPIESTHHRSFVRGEDHPSLHALLNGLSLHVDQLLQRRCAGAADRWRETHARSDRRGSAYCGSSVS